MKSTGVAAVKGAVPNARGSSSGVHFQKCVGGEADKAHGRMAEVRLGATRLEARRHGAIFSGVHSYPGSGKPYPKSDENGAKRMLKIT